MKRITTIVLAIVVIAIVAVAYLAFVGLTQAAPNVGPGKDPTGQDRQPIAYITINVDCTVIHPLFLGWAGGIKAVNVVSYPWVAGTSTINQVVKYDPLGLLNSNFASYLTIRITGPNNYIPLSWTSPTQSVKVDNVITTPVNIHFGPYTAKFWDAGSYSIVVSYYRDGGGMLATKTETFMISGM